MRCYFCNSEIPDDAMFCPECGKNLSDVPDSKKSVRDAERCWK